MTEQNPSEMGFQEPPNAEEQPNRIREALKSVRGIEGNSIALVGKPDSRWSPEVAQQVVQEEFGNSIERTETSIMVRQKVEGGEIVIIIPKDNPDAVTVDFHGRKE